MTSTTDKEMVQALRELFETWLNSRPSFRTTTEVKAAWEGWKANTAVAAMLAAHESRAQAATIHTMINHEREPHCCGCWNINPDSLIATCNECGVRRDIAKFLSAQPASVASGFTDAQRIDYLEANPRLATMGSDQDLAGLREDVRRAFAKMDRDCPRGYEVAEEWQTIRAELLRLNAELAAMKRRIADAPKAAAHDDVNIGPSLIAYMDADDLGKTFALIELDGGASER